MSNELGLSNKNASWIAYIFSFVSGIFILAIDKGDKTVRTHAWQSIFLGIAFTVLFVVLGILSLIPFLGVLFSILLWIGGLVWFLVTLFCIINVINGEIFKIPVIYDMAVKNAEGTSK
jgi:uncharacterized membrane protein